MAENETKNNAKRLIGVLKRYNDDITISRLAMILNYNKAQLARDISDLEIYIQSLENIIQNKEK